MAPLQVGLNLADLIEGQYYTGSAASTAIVEVLGTEGLLVVDNAGAGPRTVRVQLVLDR